MSDHTSLIKIESSAPSRIALKRRVWFAYISGCALWGILSYQLVFSAYQAGTLFAYRDKDYTQVSDFVPIYAGGLLAQENQTKKTNIYDPKLQLEATNRIIAPLTVTEPVFSPYPPYVYSIMMMFTQLGIKHAWLVLVVGGLIATAVAVTYTAKEFTETKIGIACATTLAIVSWPCFWSVKFGNLVIWLVPGLFLFILLLKSKRFFWAGLAGFFWMIKIQYLPIMFLVGVVLGRWRYLSGFSVVFVALILLSIGTLGWDACVGYPSMLQIQAQSGFMNMYGVTSQSLRGMLLLSLLNYGKQLIIFCQVVYVLAAAAVVLLWTKIYPSYKQHQTLAFELCLSITIICDLFFSLHCSPQDYILLSLPAIWLYKLPQAITDQNAKKAASLVWYLFLLFPIVSWCFFVFLPVSIALRIQTFALYAAALLLALSYILWKDYRSKPSETIADAG